MGVNHPFLAIGALCGAPRFGSVTTVRF